MKSSIKISLAVAAGAIGTLGGVIAITDWRPFIGDAQKQALERRVHDLQDQLNRNLPKVLQIGSNG
jgi:hypothetical protein